MENPPPATHPTNHLNINDHENGAISIQDSSPRASIGPNNNNNNNIATTTSNEPSNHADKSSDINNDGDDDDSSIEFLFTKTAAATEAPLQRKQLSMSALSVKREGENRQSSEAASLPPQLPPPRPVPPEVTVPRTVALRASLSASESSLHMTMMMIHDAVPHQQAHDSAQQPTPYQPSLSIAPTLTLSSSSIEPPLQVAAPAMATADKPSSQQSTTTATAPNPPNSMVMTAAPINQSLDAFHAAAEAAAEVVADTVTTSQRQPPNKNHDISDAGHGETNKDQTTTTQQQQNGHHQTVDKNHDYGNDPNPGENDNNSNNNNDSNDDDSSIVEVVMVVPAALTVPTALHGNHRNLVVGGSAGNATGVAAPPPLAEQPVPMAPTSDAALNGQFTQRILDDNSAVENTDAAMTVIREATVDPSMNESPVPAALDVTAATEVVEHQRSTQIAMPQSVLWSPPPISVVVGTEVLILPPNNETTTTVNADSELAQVTNGNKDQCSVAATARSSCSPQPPCVQSDALKTTTTTTATTTTHDTSSIVDNQQHEPMPARGGCDKGDMVSIEGDLSTDLTRLASGATREYEQTATVMDHVSANSVSPIAPTDLEKESTAMKEQQQQLPLLDHLGLMQEEAVPVTATNDRSSSRNTNCHAEFDLTPAAVQLQDPSDATQNIAVLLQDRSDESQGNAVVPQSSSSITVEKKNLDLAIPFAIGGRLRYQKTTARKVATTGQNGTSRRMQHPYDNNNVTSRQSDDDDDDEMSTKSSTTTPLSTAMDAEARPNDSDHSRRHSNRPQSEAEIVDDRDSSSHDSEFERLLGMDPTTSEKQQNKDDDFASKRHMFEEHAERERAHARQSGAADDPVLLDDDDDDDDDDANKPFQPIPASLMLPPHSGRAGRLLHNNNNNPERSDHKDILSDHVRPVMAPGSVQGVEARALRRQIYESHQRRPNPAIMKLGVNRRKSTATKTVQLKAATAVTAQNTSDRVSTHTAKDVGTTDLASRMMPGQEGTTITQGQGPAAVTMDHYDRSVDQVLRLLESTNATNIKVPVHVLMKPIVEVPDRTKRQRNDNDNDDDDVVSEQGSVDGGTVCLEEIDIACAQEFRSDFCDALLYDGLPHPIMSPKERDEAAQARTTAHDAISSSSSSILLPPPEARSSDVTSNNSIRQYQSPIVESDQESDSPDASGDGDPALRTSMTSVDHMSIKTVDEETGFPRWRFTTYGGTDEILYDFEINIRPSTVANAGMGAFLTFKGAKRLAPEYRVLSDFMFKSHYYHESHTRKALQATLPSGQNVSVHFTGENLHGNNNSSYWHNSTLDWNSDPMDGRLEAVIPHECLLLRPEVFHKRLESVAIRVDTNTLEGFDLTTESSQSDQPRIGFLGFHTESHYEFAPNARFGRGCECTDLGRYGPFRPKDRKTNKIFSLKSFLFREEPEEWCFGVEELLHGQLQIIDITDDATGTPHADARKEIPMYVNEVGHTLALKQNVFIRERSDRTVHYYVKIEGTMGRGESVELLTNYKQVYEPVRERKGYGWRSLNEGLESDENLAKCVERNAMGRLHIEILIQKQPLEELDKMLQFVYWNVWEPIWSKVWPVLQEYSTEPTISALQLVALRRIQWLRQHFSRRLDTIQRRFAILNPSGTERALLTGRIERSSKVIQSIQYFHDYQLDALFKVDPKAQEALRRELLEEISFEMREEIASPFNESVWCPIADRLLHHLCDEIGPILLTGQWTETNKEAFKSFLLKAAFNSAQEVEQALSPAQMNLKELTFESGLPDGCVVRGKFHEMMRVFEDSKAFFSRHSTIAKGFWAVITEILAYRDALAAAYQGPESSMESQSFPVGRDFLMIHFDASIGVDGLQCLASVPRSSASVERVASKINRTWYLVWQVGYIVDAFARKYLDKSYSLNELCAAIGVEQVLMTFATNLRMHVDEDESYREFCYNPETSDGVCNRPRRTRSSQATAALHQSTSITGFKSRLDTSPAAVAKPKAIKTPKSLTSISTSASEPRVPARLIYTGPPDPDVFPGQLENGWVQRTYQRQSGASKGATDRYWFTPKTGFKLRSRAEIHRFLERLAANNGDERAALVGFKRK